MGCSLLSMLLVVEVASYLFACFVCWFVGFFGSRRGSNENRQSIMFSFHTDQQNGRKIGIHLDEKLDLHESTDLFDAWESLWEKIFALCGVREKK
jgi:hypothetical protein